MYNKDINLTTIIGRDMYSLAENCKHILDNMHNQSSQYRLSRIEKSETYVFCFTAFSYVC